MVSTTSLAPFSAFIFAFAFLPIASAQTPIKTVPKELHRTSITANPQALNEWVNLYYGGAQEWNKLQSVIRAVIVSDWADAPSAGDAIDLDQHVYTVVFSGKRTGATDPEIVRILVGGKKRDAYSMTLPGLRRHYEIYLAETKKSTLTTVYTTTKVDNPTTTAMAGFVKQFDPKLIAPFLPFSAPLGAGTIYVQLRAAPIPEPRAAIEVEDAISTPNTFPPADLAKQAAATAAELSIRAARNNPCAKHVAARLSDAIVRVAEGTAPACVPAPAEKVGETKYERLQRWLDCTYAQAVSDPVCTSSGRPALRAAAAAISDTSAGEIGPSDPTEDAFRPEENDALAAVEARYGALIKDPGPKKISGKTTYANVPFTHVGLGTIAGVMSSVRGDTRAKVTDAGKLAADRLSGGLTLAAVNWHPMPFDPTRSRPTNAERLRLFGGVVLTPEIGLGAGLSFGILRSISINAGVGLLRVSTLRATDEFDQEPTNKSRPLVNGNANVFFFGLGYNVP